MKQRCAHAKHPEFDSYGGRGISVCDEWRDDFSRFLADVGERPSPQHSIDRIENDGHYAPDNVRWATKTEQSINRRPVRRYNFNGLSMTLREWGEHVGLPYGTLMSRLYLRWPIEKVLTTPVSESHRANRSQRTGAIPPRPGRQNRTD